MFEGLKKLFEKKKIDEETTAEESVTVTKEEETPAQSGDYAGKNQTDTEVAESKETTEHTEAGEAEAKLHDDSVILLGGKSGFVDIETTENAEEAAEEEPERETAGERATEENFSYEAAEEDIATEAAQEEQEEQDEKKETFSEETQESAGEEIIESKAETTENEEQTAEEKAEREQKFGLDLEDSAKLFGMSKESLETEFKMYKADKFAARVALSVCDPYVSAEETANRVKRAVSQKMSSATVLPNRLGVALAAANKAIKVNVAVCFPYGSDSFATRLYAVKKAARTAADGIEIPFDPTAERGKKDKILIKEYTKLVKAAKKKPLTVIIEASSYTDRELAEIINSLAEACVKAVKSSSGTRKVVADAYSEENVAKAAKGKLSYIACFNSLSAETLVKSFSYGAEFVASPTALDAVKELRILLAGKDYAAVDVAEK